MPDTSLTLPAPAKTESALPVRLLRWLAPPLVRRWRFLALGMLVWTLVSAGVAYTVKKETWEIVETLLYTSLPLPEGQKDLYAAPDVKTLASLVKSPQTLETLLQEFKLDVPPQILEKNLDVAVPTGTKALVVTCKWSNGSEGKAITKRLVELFTVQVADLRRQKVEANITDLQESERRCLQRIDDAAKTLAASHTQDNLTDFKEDLTRFRTELNVLEAGSTLARRNEANASIQIRQLEKLLADLRKDVEVDPSKPGEASEETIADNRRRQDRLRELISDERRALEIQTQLEAKKREYQRMLPLVVKGIRSQTEADQLQAEIGALLARLHENDKINQWNDEMRKIDKVVVPKGQKKSQASPIIQQTLFRKLELELQLVAIQDELQQKEKEIEETRRRIDRMGQLRTKYESLGRELESGYAERRQLADQIAGLRHLQDLGPAEFVVANPATTGTYPVSTTTKFVFAGAWAVGLFLALGLVAGRHAWAYQRTPMATAGRLELPVLAAMAGTDGEPAPEDADAQAVRRFALSVRQLVPEPGAVVLFTPLTNDERLAGWLREAAGCLTRRDERVLLLDARLRRNQDAAVPALAGLSDYLGFESADADELLQSEGCGLDHIPAGRSVAEGEAFATHRWLELLAKFRASYSIVLMLGPPADQSVDLEMLAAQVQGMVCVVEGAAPVVPATRDSLNRLRELGAPLLGSVVLRGSESDESPTHSKQPRLASRPLLALSRA